MSRASRQTPHRNLRQSIARLPVIGSAAKRLYRTIVPLRPAQRFESSPHYWEERYKGGGHSGAGSSGRLARFKADVINKFVADRGVRTVIEFGCGDGQQLALAKYAEYTGLDVSARAIDICRGKFGHDSTKRFVHTLRAEVVPPTADLALSLDVVYHLVEDDIYHAYMTALVAAARSYVCVYSSDEEVPSPAAHVRHRCFTKWIRDHAPGWQLIERVANPYPEDPQRPDDTSWADLYFFQRRQHGEATIDPT
jgi:SAM-dependent methyltransferase